MRVGQLREILTYLIEQNGGLFRFGIGQGDDEFLSTVAPDQVGVAQTATQ